MSHEDAPKRPELSAAKRALLARWARGERAAPPAAAPAPPAALERAPLSFTQGRIWFFERFEPGTSRYNMVFAVRASGPLDAAALGRAVDALVARHDVLRVRVEVEGGEPFQRVGPPRAGTLVEVDLGPAGDAAGLDLDAADFAEAEARRPFDLAAGPLHRFHLLRLAEREYALVAVVHHLVFDGWSLGVALGELAELYAAEAAGRPARLPPLPFQYPAFADRQRRAWAAGEGREDLAYWRERLHGAPPVHALPTDRPRPATQTSAGALRSRRLDPGAVAAAEALARREGQSAFAAFFAVFATLLHRLSGEDDVVVGSSVAQRTEPGSEALVGPFVNTLVLRTDLSGDPSFRTLLGRVREVERGALRHQGVPFDRLVEALGVPRDPAYRPLVQIDFVLQNFPMPALALGAVPLRPLPVDLGAAKHDLTLYLDRFDAGGALHARFEYNTDLFDAATIDALLGAYEALLAAAAAAPDARLSALPLLRDPERRAWLALAAGPPLPPPAETTLIALFERRVAQSCDSVALACRGETLTYGELDRRAAALAGRLRARGVGRGARVGIFLERTPDLVVAIVGVLKAGAAYVPFDPAAPPGRLSFLLGDADVALVVTHSALRGRLGAGAARLLDVDRGGDAAGAAPGGGPGPGARDAAYVLYTSGSTGRPTGVVVEHGGAAALIEATLRVFDENDLAVTAFTVSAGFDISVLELFAPLAAGGKVVLLPDGLALGGEGAREGVTFVSTVPTVMAELARSGALPASLRAVALGGETLSGELVAALRAARPGLRVYNIYGPTEVTVYATLGLVPEGDPAPAIGRPIEGRRVYALDAHARPALAGQPGELYVGGVGVARGYVGRPGLTAERFLPDPFSPEPGARMYRTGDFARRRPDGSFSFVGRRDGQVKVRGHRVELAEIEAALAEHPGVGECAVLAGPGPDGATRLAAYVAGRAKAPPAADELRAFAGQRLPAYMVPSAYVPLARIPRTTSGKLDRPALPPADAPRAAGEGDALPPRDALEWRLAGLWQELLGPRAAGVRADFFALGGHSLLALRLAARLEAEFGCAAPLALLFQNPTVERLAAALRQRPEGAAGAASPLVRLHAGGAARRPFFFVHGAGGSALVYAELARRLGPARPFYGLHAPGLEGDEAPAADLEGLARRYVAALRGAQARGPYALGGWSFGGGVAFEMARQLAAEGEAVDPLIFVDAPAPDLLPAAFADEASRLAAFGAALGLGPAASRVDPRALGERRGREALAFLLERATPAGAEPPLSPALAERFYRVFCRHLELAARYRPRPYAGAALLFRAALPPGAEHHDDLGWGAWLASPPEVRELAGDHHALLRPPYVDALAGAIARALDACESA